MCSQYGLYCRVHPFGYQDVLVTMFTKVSYSNSNGRSNRRASHDLESSSLSSFCCPRVGSVTFCEAGGSALGHRWRVQHSVRPRPSLPGLLHHRGKKQNEKEGCLHYFLDCCCYILCEGIKKKYCSFSCFLLRGAWVSGDISDNAMPDSWIFSFRYGFGVSGYSI